MYEILLSFITAFIPSYFIIPSVINVAKVKHLCDEPGERRSHKESTPSLGGIAIFAGLVFSIIFWTPFAAFTELQYILCSLIIIFLIGVKDDIVPMTAYKKLLGELMAAGILVIKANIRISSLHGFLGIESIPEWFSIIITIFTIIVIINAFNLIDGINGLSGSITTVICITLGTWFFLVDHIGLAILAFSLAGAVTAFLTYNFTPARIFMGDTGALLLGTICSILVIEFIEINQHMIGQPYAISAGPAVAIGILILPLFDTARVFTIRILRGRSPFSPDRLHLHHLLIDFGLTHMQATSVLVITTIMFITLVFTLQSMGTFKLLFIVLVIAMILSFLLQKTVEKRKLRLQ
jgi:UDP-N-acetylmuramyl pentapeptide phosphotransferase/UDP-N-acetylglucosamine-1-phosphate transferase